MVSLTLKVYDSSGLLVRAQAAGTAAAAVASLTARPEPYDPASGPLLLGDGAWSFDYDGRDNSGSVLRNGVYLLVIENSGPAASKAQAPLTVVGSGGDQVRLLAAPNPARGQGPIVIQWMPTVAVELKIFDLNGELVRDLGVTGPPAHWDLRGGGGDAVAAGVYLASARMPGQRRPQLFKLMVAR